MKGRKAPAWRSQQGEMSSPNFASPSSPLSFLQRLLWPETIASLRVGNHASAEKHLQPVCGSCGEQRRGDSRGAPTVGRGCDAAFLSPLQILVWHTRTEKPVLVNEGKKGFTDPNVEI